MPPPTATASRSSSITLPPPRLPTAGAGPRRATAPALPSRPASASASSSTPAVQRLSLDEMLAELDSIEPEARMLKMAEFRLQTTRRQCADLQAAAAVADVVDKAQLAQLAQLQAQEHTEMNNAARLRVLATRYELLVESVLQEDDPTAAAELTTRKATLGAKYHEFDNLALALDRVVNQLQRSLSNFQQAMLIERDLKVARRSMTIENPNEAYKRDDARKRALNLSDLGTEQYKASLRLIPANLAQQNTALHAQMQDVPQARYQAMDFGHDVAEDPLGFVAYVFHDKGKQQRLVKNNTTALVQCHAHVLTNIKAMQQYTADIRTFLVDLRHQLDDLPAKLAQDRAALLAHIRSRRQVVDVDAPPLYYDDERHHVEPSSYLNPFLD